MMKWFSQALKFSRILSWRVAGLFLFLSLAPVRGWSEETITFDLAHLDAPKRGNIGFLHSLQVNALPPEWVTELKPVIWRGGIAVSNYSKEYFKPGPGLPMVGGYEYLKNTLHVPRQLLIITPFKTEPYKTLAAEKGNQAAAAAMARDARDQGYVVEWDIKNEPDFTNMDQFMSQVWIPTVRGLRSVDPAAKIHGPSSGMVNSVLKDCHRKFFDFLERAAQSDTLPNYPNWHFQDGYDIAKSHGALAAEIREFYRAHGKKLDGVECGETVRPGNERNTSPSVAIDVFAAVEIHDLMEIHACWGSSKIYGQNLNPIPVLCGLLNKDWSGRRGVWWTYRFYAQSEGRRIECVEGPSGSRSFVGLAFADTPHHKIRALVGLRDGIKQPTTSQIRFENLSVLENGALNGKVRVTLWDNPQTEQGVDLSAATSTSILSVNQGTLELSHPLSPWGGVLIEITREALP